MSNIVVENIPLNFDETREIVGQRFSIEKNRFVMKLEEQVTFLSDIYQFQDDSLIYLKKDESTSNSMVDIVFNYIGIRDYDLIKVNSKSSVDIRRVDLKKICLVHKSYEGNYGDVKFCRINNQKNLEEISISFSKLNHIEFFNSCVFLNYYEEITKNNKSKKIYNIAVFNLDGKQKYDIMDQEIDVALDYKTEIKDGILSIINLKNGKKRSVKKMNISEYIN